LVSWTVRCPGMFERYLSKEFFSSSLHLWIATCSAL
jgi:hypothetical protein